jgi:hypothetical protein
LQVFRARNYDARLNFFEKLTLQMNLVVKWCLGGGGCGKVMREKQELTEKHST